MVCQAAKQAGFSSTEVHQLVREAKPRLKFRYKIEHFGQWAYGYTGRRCCFLQASAGRDVKR